MTAHTDRISDVVFHPAAGLPAGPAPASAQLATASVDRTIRLWGVTAAAGEDVAMAEAPETDQGETVDRVQNRAGAGVTAAAAAALTLRSQAPVATLSGHFDRLSRLVWHPDGIHLLSSRYR